MPSYDRLRDFVLCNGLGAGRVLQLLRDLRQHLRPQEDCGKEVFSRVAHDAVKLPDAVAGNRDGGGKGHENHPCNAVQTLVHGSPLQDMQDPERQVEHSAYNDNEHVLDFGRGLEVLVAVCHRLTDATGQLRKNLEQDQGRDGEANEEIDHLLAFRKWRTAQRVGFLDVIKNATVERHLPLLALRDLGHVALVYLQGTPCGRAHEHHDDGEWQPHDNGHRLEALQGILAARNQQCHGHSPFGECPEDALSHVGLTPIGSNQVDDEGATVGRCHEVEQDGKDGDRAQEGAHAVVRGHEIEPIACIVRIGEQADRADKGIRVVC
mmetsp:Transcript_73382/g.194962  ORF Transcript_73382/g.194962 Transcript_73382/m.194962 type:complete len:322 (+) Transcript_73382:179-1144(+)